MQSIRCQGAHITPSNYRVAKHHPSQLGPWDLRSLRTAPTFKSLAISCTGLFSVPNSIWPIISDNMVRPNRLEWGYIHFVLTIVVSDRSYYLSFSKPAFFYTFVHISLDIVKLLLLCNIGNNNNSNLYRKYFCLDLSLKFKLSKFVSCLCFNFLLPPK